MTLAQHSAATPEHYTPPAIIEAARAVMGGIDLDPATTKSVNDSTVKATAFFTKEDEGRARAWRGRVWLNPPGGRVGNRSSAAVWWKKLVDEYNSGRVEQAIFLGFSIEILATAQDADAWPGALPFCVPRRRIEFLREDGTPGDAPTHSNVIVYLPPNTVDLFASVERFAREFSKFGAVRT
jgi:hypothetical protein